jgi:hypothetical protein
MRYAIMVKWWPHDWNYVKVQGEVLTFDSRYHAKMHLRDFTMNGRAKIVEYSLEKA